MSAHRIRFAVQPRDIPAEKAARRLHLTLPEFDLVREELFARGFPPPDPTTGMFDLVAIDSWMNGRSNLVESLTLEPKPRDARDISKDRMEQLNNGKG